MALNLISAKNSMLDWLCLAHFQDSSHLNHHDFICSLRVIKMRLNPGQSRNNFWFMIRTLIHGKGIRRIKRESSIFRFKFKFGACTSLQFSGIYVSAARFAESYSRQLTMISIIDTINLNWMEWPMCSNNIFLFFSFQDPNKPSAHIESTNKGATAYKSGTGNYVSPEPCITAYIFRLKYAPTTKIWNQS